MNEQSENCVQINTMKLYKQIRFVSCLSEHFIEICMFISLRLPFILPCPFAILGVFAMKFSKYSNKIAQFKRIPSISRMKYTFITLLY